MKLFTYHTDVVPKVRLIGRINYKTPWKHFARTIDEYIMYIIKDGDMYIKENGVEYHLKSGDVFVLEPNLYHVGYQSAVCDYYYIHFKHPHFLSSNHENDQDFLDLMEKRRKCLMSNNLIEDNTLDPITYLPKWMSSSSGTMFHELKSITEIYKKREEFYKTYTSTRIHCFFLGLSHEMLHNHLSEMSSSASTKAEHIAEQILDYINHHYMEKITSTSLEEIFEVNFDYINRVFSKMTNTTIFKYINQLRITNAKQLIETSNLSFGEIAYLVGIEDRYYFSRQFHKLTNMTPTQYYNLTHEKKE
ncbi:MAG: AraC family transcriptional regulator [Firmicutes bacterium]|nr:AraC family transcriptional regulator [Bacillota bacterium]